MPYEILIAKQAKKNIERLTPKQKAKLHDALLNVLAEDPYAGKKLLGNLAGSYSLRLNFKDRIVYSINDSKKIVYLERARTHYGD